VSVVTPQTGAAVALGLPDATAGPSTRVTWQAATWRLWPVGGFVTWYPPTTATKQ
jgi:hypothetical protein